MPVHTFIHEATGETIDVYVPITAELNSHQSQMVDGKEFKRVYAAPLAAVNTSRGDATQEDFNRLTTDKKGMTVGQMWEISKEMHEHRTERGGVDEVQEKFYKKYQKEMGFEHDDVRRRRQMASANEKLKEMGIKVEL